MKQKFKNKPVPFFITYGDYLNSGRVYSTGNNCPFATAFKRRFPRRKFLEVNVDEVISQKGKIKAELKKWFTINDFENLARTKKPFRTFITLY